MLVHGPNNVELINFFGFGTHIPGSIKKRLNFVAYFQVQDYS